MTCRHTRLLLEDFLDHELPQAERDQVQRHLESCTDCRSEYEELVRLKELMGTVTAPDPGRDYWQQTTQVVLAKTVDSTAATAADRVAVRRREAAKTAFVRSLISAAASLAILVSAVMIGSLHRSAGDWQDPAEQPVLLSASIQEELDLRRVPVFTEYERGRLARGMLLLGAPGYLGKSAVLPEYLWAAM